MYKIFTKYRQRNLGDEDNFGLLRGDWMKGATLTEIAKHAKVSLPLVSRFMSGDPTLRISEEKRQRIIEAQKRLGGVKRTRKRIARTIISPFSRKWSIDHVYEVVMHLPFMRGFERKMKEKGFHLHFTLFHPEEKLRLFEELILSPSCDGFLLLADVVDEQLAELIRESRFPHIAVDPWVADYGVNTVVQNDRSGLRQIIKHLKSLGHKRIGYLGPRRPRYSRFVAALAEERIPIDESLSYLRDIKRPPTGEAPIFDSEKWKDYGYEGFNEWIRDGVRATALVCGNDMIAFGVIEAMKEHGLEPAKDISIVGYDNVEVRGSNPSKNPILTTIDNPITEVGERAAELLFYQIFNRSDQIIQELLPVRLIVRKTTGKNPFEE